jgi:hypothetical protein
MDVNWNEVSWDQVRRRRTRPRLEANLFTQLRQVRPAHDILREITYYPCEVVLRDGTVESRVYVAESKSYFSAWGVDPEDDPAKGFVTVRNVVAIRESPYRIPPNVADMVYATKRTERNYWFRLLLRDGRGLACTAGDAVDFIELPEGVKPDEIVSYLPGWSEGATPRDWETEATTAPYSWCLYE